MTEANTELTIAQLDGFESEFARVIESLVDEQSIRAAQAQFLGKKGRLAEVMKILGKLPQQDRAKVGAVANRVKNTIEHEVAHQRRQPPLLAEELRLGGADRLLVDERNDRAGELVSGGGDPGDQLIGRHRGTTKDQAFAMVWNATGSLIAISASILRLSAMPDVPSLPISFE